MKEPNNDDERLSALLEGRVQGQQREELLAHLSTNEDDYAVFTSTARVLRALEEEDARAAAGAAATDEPRSTGAEPDGPVSAASADIIPLRRPARRGWRSPQLAMAVAVAGVLLVSSLVWRGQSAGAADPVRLAARVEGLPAGWVDTLPWGARSGTPVGSRNAQAAQAGALLVDLAVAIRARDTATTVSLASTLLRAYEPGTGQGTPLAQIEARAGAPPDSLQPLLARATDRLGNVLGENHLRLGAWTEAARLAANARDGAFFDDRASRVMLRRAGGLTAGDAAAQTALLEVRALVDAEPRSWASIQYALKELMSALAS